MRANVVSVAIIGLALLGWAAVGWASGSHNHAGHDPGLCHELRIQLGGSNGPMGPPINTPGRFPVAITFLSRGYGIECGNGLKIFVDMLLAHSNENVDSDDYQWDLDLSAIAEGLHYILINACDHNDHIGVASVVIDVRKCMLPGAACGKKIGVPIPPGNGGGLTGAIPGLQSRVAPPAFDTDLQPAAIACCGAYGDWPVGADCCVMVPVPKAVSDTDPSTGDF